MIVSEKTKQNKIDNNMIIISSIFLIISFIYLLHSINYKNKIKQPQFNIDDLIINNNRFYIYKII